MPLRKGDTGTIRSGVYRNLAATVTEAEGDNLHVTVNFFGRPTAITIAASHFEAADAPRRSVSPTCAFQPDDTVLVHGGYGRAIAGTEYLVREVDEAKRGLVLVESAPDDVVGPVEVTFDDVTLVSPLRRDILPDYVAALRRSAGKRGEQKDLQLWAARQVSRVAWDPYHPSLGRTSLLATEYAELESRKWREAHAVLEQAETELLAQFEALAPDDRVALWKRTWADWVETNASARASWTESERQELTALESSQRDAVFTLRERFQRRRWDFSDPQRDTPADEPAAREDIEYEAWRAAHTPTPPESLGERMEKALAAVMARFPAVEAHVTRVWGLQLPRHVAVARAFFDVAGTLRTRDPRYPDLGELDALRFSSGLTEGYLLDLFAPGSLERAVRPGVDERLADRAYHDPPEMLTVMNGMIDGLHWGLWYDDPRFLPAFVVSSYASDDPVIATGAATVLGEIRARLSLDEDPVVDGETEEDRASQRVSRFERRLLREYASALDDADRDAVAQDAAGACPYPRGEELRGSPGIAAPRELLEPMPIELTTRGTDEVTPAEVRQLVALAYDKLAAGRPVVALALARELHYRLDQLADPGVTEALFDAAYRALGRVPLAEIARVHRALRGDTRRVEVFAADEPS